MGAKCLILVPSFCLLQQLLATNNESDDELAQGQRALNGEPGEETLGDARMPFVKVDQAPHCLPAMVHGLH